MSVANAETILRSVPAKSGNGVVDYFQYQEGVLRISVQAFADRERKISVDRMSLLASPNQAKRGAGDGVVSLSVLDVRSIKSVYKGDEANRTNFQPDVIADPIKASPSEVANDAHALVITIPDCSSKSERKVYDRLREALSLLASRNGWLVDPSD